MIDKRRCSLPENRKFFLNQFFVVIDSRCSIPPDIILNSTNNIIWRTVQNNNCVDLGNCCDVASLPSVTRYSIQHEHIAFREPDPVQIQGNDLFSEGEVLVLEQEAELENTVNEIELLFRIGD